MNAQHVKRFKRVVVCAVLVLFGFTIPTFAAEQQKAVVVTAAADYSSGAHSVINVDPADGPKDYTNNLAPTVSDLTIVAQGRYFYRIEQFFADNIAKFDIANPGTPIWQYSTMDQNDTVSSSNPQDIVFASPDKAYLLRQNTPTAWIVNPQAASEASFKVGTLDLSSYNDGDGYSPEMTQAIVVKGKLFILMQRLDQNDNWTPQEGYLAVFDTVTDAEIDTWQGRDGRKGILLPVKNPSTLYYLPENDTIYVQGSGRLESTFSGTPAEYTGGIAAIDPDTYKTRMVLDDGDDLNHTYGNITGMVIVSSTKGYFVGYEDFGNNTLYSFNPSNGEVDGAPVEILKNTNIQGMEAGGAVDQNGLVWITDATNAQVVIIDPADDSVKDTVPTNLNPQKIVFVTFDDDNIDITGNGEQGPLSFSTRDKISLALTFNAGQNRGQDAEWWIAAVVDESVFYSLQLKPFGWAKGFVAPSFQDRKADFSGIEVYNNYLPAGSYTFIFAVDDKPNGVIDLPSALWDILEIKITGDR